MRSIVQLLLAMVGAAALVIAGLWSWQAAADLVSEWPVSRPQLLIWAIRCAAIGGVALGQLLAVRFAFAALYRRRLLDDLLRLSAAVACVIALVSALALGLAGR